MISSKEEVEVETKNYPETEMIPNKTTKSKKRNNIFIKLSYVLCTKKANVKKEHNAILHMVLNS